MLTLLQRSNLTTTFCSSWQPGCDHATLLDTAGFAEYFLKKVGDIFKTPLHFCRCRMSNGRRQPAWRYLCSQPRRLSCIILSSPSKSSSLDPEHIYVHPLLSVLVCDRWLTDDSHWKWTNNRWCFWRRAHLPTKQNCRSADCQNLCQQIRIRLQCSSAPKILYGAGFGEGKGKEEERASVHLVLAIPWPCMTSTV